MQRAYSWHSSPLLVGGLPVMCVFLTADFCECALSASLFISACLSSCQNLFGHMCFFLFDFACLSADVRTGEKVLAWERVFDNLSPLCFLTVCTHLQVCVTAACWLTDCCSAFWQTVPLNHAALVTRSDRTLLLPWYASIRISPTLNEDVNMLNCLLEMRWRGCLNAAHHVWCPHN